MKPVGDPLPVLVTLGHHCSDKEQNAEWAEREVIKIKILHFLNKQIGENMPGVISGVTLKVSTFAEPSSLPKALCRSQNYPAIATALKSRDIYIEGFRSGNRFRLGDELTVRIDEVDLARRSLFLSVVTNHTARGEASAPKRTGGKAVKRAEHTQPQTKRRKVQIEVKLAERQVARSQKTPPLTCTRLTPLQLES